MSARLRFWLFAWDAAVALGIAPLGSRLYYWLLERASAATEWE